MSETKETIDHFALAQALREIALNAGHAILDIYERDDHGVVRKDDKSPVTDADVAAEKIILEGLKRLTPDIPVVAEEEVAAGRVPDISGPAFWLVDPLDGTKEFINRNGEFTVNIALIEGDQPTLGVVYAPAKKRLFLGWLDQATVEENAGEDGAAPSPISVRTAPESGIKVVASRSHRSAETNAFIDKFQVEEIISAGSSLKLCLVAAGEADLYPRLSPTMEWDIAAGHAVLKAAGGVITQPDGSAFLYGKDEFRNPSFIAWGGLTPIAA